MKLAKLNPLGVAHLIAPLLIVVGIAVAGSLALVLSHAQSCTPVSGVVSSPTSSPVTTCTPTSGPTSSPTSSPTLVKGGPCYLGTRGVNNGIIVLNKTGTAGNCAQYSNGAIYYTGVSGKNVLCTKSARINNGVYVCVKS